jgi:hypothetical protein
MKNQRNRSRVHVGLTLALVGLCGATLMSYRARTASAQGASPSWKYTGDLSAARTGHTATLLHNGKVLVAGGDIDGKGAELYDPATGVWTNTGSLNVARYYHTATLLPSGKVLVTGGSTDVFVNSGITESAELYDPATETWTSTGNLRNALVFHTATLLKTGKVLVTGGANFVEYVRGAELYDPDTETWAPTGNLNTSRIIHTATLLPNGKVLAAAGFHDASLNSAELYDPTTGEWSYTGNLNVRRDYHTATLLLNGKILVTGGNNEDLFTSILLDSSELYDPATGTWSSTSSLNKFRWLHTATLLPNGKVLVAAGSDGEIDLTSSELYDPDSGTWSITASLNSARSSQTAILLSSGKVLVAAGGYPDFMSSAELYDSGVSPTATPTPAASIQFSSLNYNVNEGAGSVNVTVTRTGDLSGAASVDYKTIDDPAEVRCDTINGTAYARCDYATTVDTLTFASGETSKTFAVPIIDDDFAEGDETFGIALSNPVGAILGTPSTATVTIIDNDTVTGANPIFTTPFFVRQHYLDFLSREPEASEPWSAVLSNCSDVNSNPACDRLTVSAAFFGSPEFQLKGYFVYRFYKLAFNRLPTYGEIVVDMRSVTGQTPSEVFQKKAAFTNAFVQRTEFTSAYNVMSNEQYVSTLMGRYALTLITSPDPATPDGSNKVTLTSTDLTNQLNANTLTRAQVLRAVADSDQVLGLEFNQAFVAMQYYGYLRRTPESAGYNTWLNYLNANPADFRTMVNGFMNSTEYRLRFGR